MATEARTRLPPSVFRLPVERIREGYYSDAYFNYTKRLLEEQGRCPSVTMQVFQKQEAVLGGIHEGTAELPEPAGHRADGGWVVGWEVVEVQALQEGDE